MSNRPKISVIIATHNNEEHLGECLDSVLCGDLTDIEVILVDVLSTDGTKEVISDAADMDDRVVFLADSYGSLGRAKNIGIDHAIAPYVVIVEPEDTVDRHMLDYFYHEMEDSPHTDLMTCEVDIFGNDIYGRTSHDKKERLGGANRADNRKVQMDSRIFRWQAFETCGCYRKSYLEKCGIRHYEEPGVGGQSVAFKFLTSVKARVAAETDMMLYSRRMDMIDKPLNDEKAVTDVCNEYRYLKKELQKNPNDWWQFHFVYWHAYYTSNMELYEKLSDELKPALSKRMQGDLRQAIRQKEISRDNLDIQTKADIELLLSSTAEFDAKQGKIALDRRKISTDKRDYEKRYRSMLEGQATKEQEAVAKRSRESEEHTAESRLNRKWLTSEMGRDLAPLRLLIGLSQEEMGNILGMSGSAYKSLENGKKEVSWDQYLALLFIFRYNDRTAAVTDTLGLYPEALDKRMRKGIMGRICV